MFNGEGHGTKTELLWRKKEKDSYLVEIQSFYSFTLASVKLTNELSGKTGFFRESY